MSKKYYAVRVGQKPGIYTTWAEAKKQVDGYPNAVYKSFKTLKEAEFFIQKTDSSIKENVHSSKKRPSNSSQSAAA